jgi:hypothetical protein
MIKKRELVNLCLLTILILFFFLRINAVAIPFDPIPTSPYQGTYWDVNIGDIFRWNITAYEGDNLINSMDYSYKINGTDFISWYDDNYYCLKLRKMLYNESTEVFYADPIITNLLNFSLVNFTIPRMYPFQGGQPITFFIPKIDRNLMTDWCADASYFQYKTHFDAESPETYTNRNTIRYYNNTTEEYIEFQYCEDGSLRNCYEYFNNFSTYDEYTLQVEQLYPRCDDFPNPTPTINIGFFFLLYSSLTIMGLVLFLYKKNKIKS